MADGFRDVYARSADGLRLHARLYEGPAANAPNVLCLHGLTRNCRDFEDLAPHLSRRYRVLAGDGDFFEGEKRGVAGEEAGLLLEPHVDAESLLPGVHKEGCEPLRLALGVREHYDVGRRRPVGDQVLRA